MHDEGDREANANSSEADYGKNTKEAKDVQGGSKRKLGEEGGEADAAAEASKEEGGYEDEDPEASDAVGEQEGRARKRTKTAEKGAASEKVDSA